MADELTLAFETVGSAADVLVLAFTSYKALQIRRSLAVGLYRRQALWLAAITGFYTLLIAETFFFVFVYPTTNPLVDWAASLSQQAGIISVFAWVDTSTRIARRSDPLLRDTLAWTKIRLVVWAVLAIGVATTFYFAAGQIIGGGSLDVATTASEFVSLSGFLLTPYVVGSILIPLSAARSGDPVLRRHFRWFGLFMVILLVTVLTAIAVLLEYPDWGYLDIVHVLLGLSPASTGGFFVIVFAAGFAAYRSAKSLVPLNRIPLEPES
jgi:hypothetical protein